MENQNHVRKRTVAFRQWTRKPYAMFNSLKLVVKIGVLSATYTLVNPIQESKAQSDSTHIKKIELEEVEVSGQRTPVVNSQMARIVSVVTRSEVDRAPVQSINDLLRYVPQVDMRQRGANGAQADISIQGGSFDQTLILLNGINLSDPQTGHYSLNLPIEIESVDRIEVLKGSASRVFGTNAFAGAVNFVTGTDTTNYVKLSQIAGDHSMYRSSATINQHDKWIQNFVSVSKSKSNGYTHNTDYDFKNVFYHGKTFYKQSNLGIQLGYSQKDYGANSFYTPVYPDQYEYNGTYFGALNAETQVASVKLSPVAYWRRNYDHYILIKSKPSAYQNFHCTDVYGAGLNTNFQTSLGKTSIGFEYRKELIYSTNLGVPMADTKKIPGEDTIRYNLSDAQENLSAYLEHNITIDRFSASAGVMVNRNTKLSNIEFYPGLDIGYQLLEPLKLYASVNRSLRLPTFTDLYYHGPQNLGNPDLKPEEAIAVETGLKLSSNGMSGNLSYFHRWGTNIISWIKESNTTIWHTENITTLNTDGVELFANVTPGYYFPAISFVKNVHMSYSFTSLSQKSNNMDTNYALDNLKHKVVVSIDHIIYKQIGASWRFSWQQRNGRFDLYNGANQTPTNINYPAIALFDGKVYYKTKALTLFAESTNIFNKTYYDIGNIVQPGRWFKAGLELNINWKN
jgi:vitamin B12 transporter